MIATNPPCSPVNASISSARIRSSSSVADPPSLASLLCLVFAVLLHASATSASADGPGAAILTVRDEVLPRGATPDASLPSTPIRFETPADGPALDRLDLDSLLRAEQFPGLRFEDVKALLFRRESRRWIGSDARRIEVYRLGPAGGAAAPPPPRWATAFGSHTSWSPAVPAAVGPETPYVNRAQAVWADDTPTRPESAGEFLFRTEFVIDNADSLESARLILACRSRLLEIRFNDRPIVMGPVGAMTRGEFEITPLLREGPNILGFWVATRGPAEIPSPSLAFAIELLHTARRGPADRQPSGDAILTTRLGDRVQGRILTFNPVSVLLRTPYGRYSADWDRIQSIVFPEGWNTPPPPRSPLARRMDRFLGRGDVYLGSATGSAPPLGLPLDRPAEAPSHGVLLRDGRFLPGEMDSLNAEELYIRHEGSGDSTPLDRAEVAAVYPPATETLPLERPALPFSALQCRLRTVRGEVFSGVLRQIHTRRIVVEQPGEGLLDFHPDQVVWIWFPGHRDRDLRVAASGRNVSKPAGARVALLGLESPRTPMTDSTRRLYHDVQQAAFIAGLDTEFPPVAVLADPERLTPRAYPVAVLADADGGYLDSLEREGDARDALVAYLESGGILVVYARRGALLTAIRAVESRLERHAPVQGPSLARILNLAVLSPTDTDGRPESPFDAPPNLPVALLMKRAASVPPGLGALPSTVDVPPLERADFHPVVATDRAHETIYELTTDSGKTFGPAMILARRGAGRIVVVDRLLWEAQVEGRPFRQVALPQILAWAWELPR
jgi:hypothetical protein